nr:helix-turn-helix transcriptional regulator [Bacillota bacterium]
AQADLRKTHLQQLAAKIDERIAAGYIDDNLSAASIAEEMGMNAVYLGRLYREISGISIGEALKRTRIENAKRLLVETSDSVKEIADRVGFSNNKYFYVVFKELVGLTPKEFQAQERAKNH